MQKISWIWKTDREFALVREHRIEDWQAAAASLKQYGQLKPIVVNGKNSQIVAGNGTLRAAKSLDWKHLAVVYVKMDAAAQAGYAVADNRTAELAQWDDELLALLAEEIQTAAPDLYDDLLLAELVGEEEAGGDVAGASDAAEEFYLVVDCADADQQQRLFFELKGRGLKCRRS